MGRKKYWVDDENFANIDFVHVNDNLPRYGDNFDYGGEKSNWCVYAHINKINGKIYIGITSSLEKRWMCNGEGYKGCDAFYNAIQTYGFNNFKHVVIMNGLTKTMAGIIEKELIQKYNTTERNAIGYNIADGGVGNNHGSTINENKLQPIYQYDMSGIFIQKFDCARDALKLMAYPAQSTSTNLSHALQKEHPFLYGFLWSKEYKERLEPFVPKMSQYHLESYKTTDTIHNNILQIDLYGNIIKEYSNIYYVSDTPYIRRNIVDQLTHYKEAPLSGDYVWIYKQEYSNEYVLKLLKNIRNKYIDTKKAYIFPVVSYDNNGNCIESFENAYAAAEKMEGNPYQIISACRGLLTRSYKRQWRFWIDDAPGEYIDTWHKPKTFNLKMINPKTNDIIMEFNNYKDVSNFLNIEKVSSGVLDCAKGKRKTSYGYIWRFYDNQGNIIDLNKSKEE